MSDPNVPREQYQPSQSLPPGYVHPAYSNQPSPNPGHANPVYVHPVYAVAPPRGLSVSSLVIGIVSFFFGFTLILPLVGVILGFAGLRREPAGRGMAIAGIWINALILAFTAIVLIVIVLGVVGLIGVSIPFIGEIGDSGSVAA